MQELARNWWALVVRGVLAIAVARRRGALGRGLRDQPAVQG